MKTTYAPEEKITATIEKLKELNKKITVKNILLQSLFLAGGTPSEKQIKNHLKNL